MARSARRSRTASRVAAGAVVTVCLLRAGPGCTGWLPGLWAMLFGLGLVAARPYLPRHIGVVALLPDGKSLLFASWDTTLRYWDIVSVHGSRVTNVQRGAEAEKYTNRKGHPQVAW